MNMLTTRALAVAAALAFSAGASAQALSNAEYKSAKDGIAAGYKADRAACASPARCRSPITAMPSSIWRSRR